MTQRNQECKVQVQASRVSARIAALTIVALALALTPNPVTHSDNERRPEPAADDSQLRDGRRVVPRKGTLGGSSRLLSSRDVAAILTMRELSLLTGSNARYLDQSLAHPGFTKRATSAIHRRV